LKRTLISYKNDDFDPSYFWNIPEWEYEGIDDNTLYKFLATFIYVIEDEKYESVMKDYENTLIEALKTCEKNEVFGKGKVRESIIVYLQYTDATDEEVDDISSKQINPKNIHSLFKERWNSETNNLTKTITNKIKTLS